MNFDAIQPGLSGEVRLVTLAEKLLVPLLVKLTNLVPDSGIWVWDFRNARVTRLTSGQDVHQTPVWAADGRRVIFWSRIFSSALNTPSGLPHAARSSPSLAPWIWNRSTWSVRRRWRLASKSRMAPS